MTKQTQPNMTADDFVHDTSVVDLSAKCALTLDGTDNRAYARAESLVKLLDIPGMTQAIAGELVKRAHAELIAQSLRTSADQSDSDLYALALTQRSVGMTQGYVSHHTSAYGFADSVATNKGERQRVFTAVFSAYRNFKFGKKSFTEVFDFAQTLETGRADYALEQIAEIVRAGKPESEPKASLLDRLVESMVNLVSVQPDDKRATYVEAFTAALADADVSDDYVNMVAASA